MNEKQPCPGCRATDNNPYIDANGNRMRACGRCDIQWRAESAPEAHPPVEPDACRVGEIYPAMVNGVPGNNVVLAAEPSKPEPPVAQAKQYAGETETFYPSAINMRVVAYEREAKAQAELRMAAESELASLRAQLGERGIDWPCANSILHCRTETCVYCDRDSAESRANIAEEKLADIGRKVQQFERIDEIMFKEAGHTGKPDCVCFLCTDKLSAMRFANKNLAKRAEAAESRVGQLEQALREPDIELLSSRVHDAYLVTCHRLGWSVKESNIVPYSQLSEDSKELDRASVRAVLEALLERKG